MSTSKIPTGFAFATLVVLVSGTLPGRGADWPQYLGPQRDGHSHETGLLAQWQADGPERLWSLEVGAGFAGVAVAEGKVYLFHRVGNEEILQQLDAATGAKGWSLAYPTRYVDDFGFDAGPRATPVVAGDRIVTLGPNGDLHATDRKTGTKIWSRNVLADYSASKGFFGAASTPLVVGNHLLVNVGGKDAGIVAFDVQSGKELWKATRDAASYSSPTLGKIQGQDRAIFLTRAGLVILDPKTGTVSHTLPFRSRLEASVNAATPLVRDGEVFLTSSYGVGAIRLKPQGQELDEIWANDRALSCHYNTPILVGDYLYGVHGRQEGGGAELRCVSWATGEVRWTRERYGCTSLIAVDGAILALTEAGDLVRFVPDPQAYRETGRAKILNFPTRAAPALADGRLYARDEQMLVCLRLK